MVFHSYPFNNLLHHQAENIFISCFESNSKILRDHLLQDCNFIARILEADENPYVLSTDGKVCNQKPFTCLAFYWRSLSLLAQYACINSDLAHYFCLFVTVIVTAYSTGAW